MAFVMKTKFFSWQTIALLVSAALLVLPAWRSSQLLESHLSPVDRKIDELGAETRIRSHKDAEAYIEALVKRFGLDEARLPDLDELKSRLARAEYAAVHEPSRRISEARVANVFDKWMGEMSAPKWARTSVSQVRDLRLGVAKILLPHVIRRSPQGDIPDTVRPAEAIYLLWLLEFQFRSPHTTEGAALNPNTAGMPDRTESLRPFHASRPTGETLQRQHSYETARENYFNRHSGAELQLRVTQLFDTLGID